MASIGEMLQYAQAIQERKRNPWASTAENAIKGYYAGKTQARQIQKDSLDRALKLIEIQEKLAQIDAQKQQQEVMGNIYKSMGVLPYNETENSISRSVANESIGSKAKKDSINTENGKMRKMFEMASTDDYVAVPNISSGKPSLRLEKKDKGYVTDKVNALDKGPTGRQFVNTQKDILQIATQMARREKLASMKQKMGEDYVPMNAMEIEPTQDMVSKYIPIAKKFLSNDIEGYDKDMKVMQKRTNLSYDPFGEDEFGDEDLDLE